MKTYNNIIAENGYSVDEGLGGSYRLMRGDCLIYDDPACEDLCESRELAEAFFSEYIKESVKSYEVEFGKYHVRVTEDEEYYHIDFRAGLGEAHYAKSEFTLDEALADQADI